MSAIPKVALITGCSEPQSIGAAFALNLRKNGWRVYATARKLDNMEALKAAGCDVLALDVQSAESIKAAAKTVTEQAGRLDLIINNAGVVTLAPIIGSDLDKVSQVLDINSIGPLRVLQGFSEILIKTANDPALALDDGHSVSIINVGSGARIGIPFESAYSASKAALHAISEVMRHELSAFGITVTCVDLNMVKTAMSMVQKNLESTSPSEISKFYPNWDQINQHISELFGTFSSIAHTPEKAAEDILQGIYKNEYPPTINAGFKGDMEFTDETLRGMFGVQSTPKPKY